MRYLLWLVVWFGSSYHVLADERPNFLLVLLDDAGWTDVGCFGSRIETPNIDRIAAAGMRLTDCHSAAPNCSPSRAGLLTGRTPSRVGVYSYLPAGHVMHLRAQEVTIAELLQAEGYRTGHFGKWHLSRLMSDQPQPSDQGFEYSLGTDNNAVPSHHNPTNFVRNGTPVGQMEGYSCQLVVDEAMGWLDQMNAGDADDPFFACVWFHEPHTPIASPPDLVDKYRKKYPQLNVKQATYHANVENADRAVGRLMRKLDELEIADETVVFVTSDNGPLNEFSSVGLRGKKSHVWEGGHRVPGMFRWPGHIEAGSVSSVPVSGVDYLPTVCEIAGIDPPKNRRLDGTSIVPVLLRNAQSLDRNSPLYWFFYRLNPSLAVRDGDWVLIADTNDATRPKAHPLVREDMVRIRESKGVAYELFDLSSDLAQQQDLSTLQPEVFQRMRKAAEAMHQSVVREGHQWDIPEDYGAGAQRRIWNSR